jgi:hypothetical protein
LLITTRLLSSGLKPTFRKIQRGQFSSPTKTPILICGYTILMLAIVVAGVVTIIASFGAAWFGARLQRKWTPNPIPPIENLGSRIEAVRQRMEAIEQERLEAAHFTLGIQLRQAVLNNYILEVTNDSDKDVSVETIQFFLGDTPLSGIDKPKPTDDWRILAHSRKQLMWPPSSDPIMTLKLSGTQPHGFAQPYRIVLGCRCEGKTRTAQRTLLLTYRDNSLTQYGP